MNNVNKVNELTDFLVSSIESASAFEFPFHHIQLGSIFPEHVYREMIEKMPVASDYRPLPGRGGGNLLVDGRATRVKIDLFPEYVRHLPAEKRPIWDMVGRALCSRAVQSAFIRRLQPGLERRYGEKYRTVGMYPIPVLTRDIPGYEITPHTDTHWKGMTIQIYLPPDDANAHIGTIFHDTLPDGTRPKVKQMPFKRNVGYAFAVGDNTWHSADPVGREVTTRDSILLTYFVDAGLLRVLRNRGKRVGNLIRNEVKQLTR